MKTTFVALALVASLVTANPIVPTATPVPTQFDTRYACEVSTDCAVVNRGNCCGYYPVCANSKAVFTKADACPNGGVSVCGWPEISSCGCMRGLCVAVHSGARGVGPIVDT
ncbi:uncharacterized protein BDR25DRAFT_307261 [Lindgomyces ingoldianus]|uniref:Uncharacterized protein n=1 Tax=Lindgomyces ingoldianus TaxID=673940 RepID=A0ACB6QBK0_9PLEO|nr:uncharacterized protein BDR25DRAFT_307261 [Lindgomyces ingoldianus]KAF2464235.1 hypothetical protein BDR25DRAFT_307261 [Lindgomyces ingoldianus]